MDSEFDSDFEFDHDDDVFELMEDGCIPTDQDGVALVCPEMLTVSMDAFVCSLVLLPRLPRDSSNKSSRSRSQEESKDAPQPPPPTEEEEETEEERRARTQVLSSDDGLWLKYRHQHINFVKDDVTAEFRRFMGKQTQSSIPLSSDPFSSVDSSHSFIYAFLLFFLL